MKGCHQPIGVWPRTSLVVYKVIISTKTGGLTMSYRQLSKEGCNHDDDCPSVWTDADPEHVVIVGKVLPAGTVPTGPDEVAVRIRRSTVVAAGLG